MIQKFRPNFGDKPLQWVRRELSGKTFYWDEATTKSFKSRLVEAYLMFNRYGLVTVERLAENYDGTGRVHKVSLFDPTGQVVLESDKYASLSRAKAEFKEKLAEFDYKSDLIQTYKQLAANAARDAQEVVNLKLDSD